MGFGNSNHHQLHKPVNINGIEFKLCSINFDNLDSIDGEHMYEIDMHIYMSIQNTKFCEAFQNQNIQVFHLFENTRLFPKFVLCCIKS